MRSRTSTSTSRPTSTIPDGHYLRAQIEAKLGNVQKPRKSATTAIKHYMIVNDQAGATRAKALLDSVNASPAPAPTTSPP